MEGPVLPLEPLPSDLSPLLLPPLVPPPLPSPPLPSAPSEAISPDCISSASVCFRCTSQGCVAGDNPPAQETAGQAVAMGEEGRREDGPEPLPVLVTTSWQSHPPGYFVLPWACFLAYLFSHLKSNQKNKPARWLFHTHTHTHTDFHAWLTSHTPSHSCTR